VGTGGDDIMKRILVCGVNGFIGSYMANRLKDEGHWVRGIDYWSLSKSNPQMDEWILNDLKVSKYCDKAMEGIDEVYQFAAEMGGAGFLFTGENDARVMWMSAKININVLNSCIKYGVKKIFFPSSACVYPKRMQLKRNHGGLSEHLAIPAEPDSPYGWEKLYSEKLYESFSKVYGIDVRIARLHNVYGPRCEFDGGKEKVPAAICRKVAEAKDGEEIEIWGDGKQTRSFLYIDECIEGIRRLMESNVSEPINIGSDRCISINDLARLVIAISGKDLTIKNTPGPVGVQGRNSDNRLIHKELGWVPSTDLERGMRLTYKWIEREINGV